MVAQEEEEKSQVAQSESLRINSEKNGKGASKPPAATQSQGEEET
jgi:hypothetical protein